jgi:hypothetical protein
MKEKFASHERDFNKGAYPQDAADFYGFFAGRRGTQRLLPEVRTVLPICLGLPVL